MFKVRTVFIGFLLLVSIPDYAKHPLHLSVVNMTIDIETRQIEYSMRLFQEDVIVLMQLLYHDAMHKNLPLDSTLVGNYFTSNFKISDGTKTLVPLLIKSESNELEYWLYYSVSLTDVPEKIIIDNSIMLEIFSDQQNLLIFSTGNIEKGLTFDKKTTQHQINLINAGN